MAIVYDNVREAFFVGREVQRVTGCGFLLRINDKNAILDFGKLKPRNTENSELTISGNATGGDLLRSEYLAREELKHILAALGRENRLALEVSMATGLRISDVLALRTEQVQSAKGGRVTVREQKTGKYRRVYLAAVYIDRMLKIAGRIYVFQHRLDFRKHRTRQAVYKDIRRVAEAFHIKPHISPHSCRKVYAVEFFHKCGGNLGKVQKLLNHENEAVTMVYALADVLYDRTYKGKKKHPNKCSG